MDIITIAYNDEQVIRVITSGEDTEKIKRALYETIEGIEYGERVKQEAEEE